ncbi:oxidoreductase [Pullulanibacillus camelliae]|uniref:Oxidoreductase n=1 Tax=Pullulanibacillus camelliae TaxID=1707096 RepID=A0A8J2YKU5_9BACL|nr:Gfo/Idh/MocA family oxidoreductase [Pullulanibacillus camelliae]GGE49250.1 oxidoreductase [Pullulanibacillus camelliae]
MDKVRVGVVGLGNMGSTHAKYLAAGVVQGAELTAVCDINPDRLSWAETALGSHITTFDTIECFLSFPDLDAVIICTLHYTHPDVAIKAFAHGLHVLIEKPAGVYTKQVREMNEAAKQSGRAFGIMYNQRTNPLYVKVKALIETGELGEIRRTNWTITDWYRSQAYYDSGSWRATWSGEGGGVLLNQCPHQLDLWQWMLGMLPYRVRAFCSFGKYRQIEVEDEVTAYVEYTNGATGVFMTTTAEAPGTNRLEIVGDKGKVVIEEEKLHFWQLQTPETKFNQTNTEPFAQPESWQCHVPIHYKPNENGHQKITQNWVEHILKGVPLLAPGVEGIRGLELSNAMYLSSWRADWVELPIDEQAYYEALQKRIASSHSRQV